MSAKNRKKNNLYTRTIPSLMMLSAGAVAFFVSLRNGYSTGKLLLVVLVVMFVFAILVLLLNRWWIRSTCIRIMKTSLRWRKVRKVKAETSAK